ncbi:sigma-70 family RNA polymerase sigma factor [Roseimicrobium sp. ORNL1]|nr:sigma-70 family RNA polymerase sigma factor [Roseimicrobium sp. ORNL1]
MSDVTCLLDAIRKGDPDAEEKLLHEVYAELRRLARARMAREQSGQTLQPTALVHEAWLRLGNGVRFENRAHFFGAAAEAMRRILVESARRKMRRKHGGELERVDFVEVEIAQPMPDDDLLVLDEALDRLAGVDARAAEVVKLCYLVGHTRQEAADVLGISLSTVERLWSFARAWLFREMEGMRNPPA